MPRTPDPERLQEFAGSVFHSLQGAMTSAMICLGDRRGLYQTLAGGEAVSSEALAQQTGLSERWLREWLHQQGAAGVLEHRGEERFALSPEAEAVLANEDHPAFGAGWFSSLPQTMGVLEELPEAFRTGIGLDYDALGAEGARGVERGFGAWFRSLLVPVALPRVEGVVEALGRGIRVADVGCGGGVALVEIATAFPASEYHGYETSQHALDRARANASAAGLENVHFHDVRQEPLPEDGRFGFVPSFDCLHDMPDPVSVIQAIRGALAAITGDFGVPILPSADTAETADLLMALLERSRREPGPAQLRPAAGELSPEEQQRHILEGLPGVSAVLAQRLLHHFRSVAAVFAADAEVLRAVEGIGALKAAAIRDAIERKWEP